MGDRNTSQPSAVTTLLTSNQDAQINPWMMVSRNHEVLQNIYMGDGELSTRTLREKGNREISGRTGQDIEDGEISSGALGPANPTVKFKHGGVAREPLVVELVNRFCEGEKNENVGMQGAVRIFPLSNLYVPTKDGGYIIDTNTMSRSSSFPPILGYKSIPIIVSAYDKLYCLASPFSIPPIPEPSFERFDPDTNMWKKMPPYPFYNDYETRMNISENNFNVIAFHVGRKQCKPVEVDDSVYNAPFQGRAVVVGKTIYSLRRGEVIAFSLGLDKDHNGGVVYNLNQLFVLQGLEVANPLFAFDMCWSEYLVHLGNNDFFHVKTECGNDTAPYLRITTFQIVVGEGGRHMIKTIYSNVHSVDLEDVDCECGDYEPTEEESVTSMNQPKQVETNLDDNCSVVKPRRLAKVKEPSPVNDRSKPLMQVATTASSFVLHTRMLVVPTTHRALNSSRTQTTSSPTLPRASLCTNFLSPFLRTSISSEFSDHKFRPLSLNLASFRGSKPKHDVVTMSNRPPQCVTTKPGGGFGGFQLLQVVYIP
ncbi:hypothetical protein ACE6H2_016775 [Prunus campanulata]